MGASLLDDVRGGAVEVGGISAGDGEDRLVGQDIGALFDREHRGVGEE